MGEVVVNSTVVVRFKLSRFDRFEARNRPHLHILAASPDIAFGSSGERTEDYLHSTLA